MTTVRDPMRDTAPARGTGVSRRRFLRGLGACVALPAFESLRPFARAAATDRLATSATGAPVRMAFLYFPNGAIPATWWPTGEGKEFQLNRTLQPLEPVKHRIQVIAGLDHQNATPGPDGPGDHARASGCFLTGVRVKKTAGSDIRAGVSIDQLAAQKIGHLTRFPSLELSCDAVRKSGSCDSGYSCAYEYNLAWRSPTTPMPPEPNPRLVFERLFGVGRRGERGASFEVRKEQQRSVLDFVLDDARTLQGTLGSRDKQKLDEYLTSVRAVEQRIAAAEQLGPVPDPAVETPPGIPPKFEEHMRLMYSLLLLAFQTDSTRIATLLLAHDGDNRPYPDLGIPEGHHYLTHHGNRKEMVEKVKDIDLFYARQLGWFLGELERTKDADGQSLLQNAMIVYGCANSDGNRHTHSNLPIVLAGGGGGRLTAGRSLKLRSTPMCNLYLSLLDGLVIAGVDRFGDSTGRIEGI